MAGRWYVLTTCSEYLPRSSDHWRLFQNVHAIGDRANGIVIDAFEASLDGVNVTALRPRLEHAQIITKEDMLRLGKLGGSSFLIEICMPS